MMNKNQKNNNDVSLWVSNLRLTYPLPDGNKLTVLNIDEFSTAQGFTVALMGPSGSGKTSLLYVLAGIEKPQNGVVQWGNITINKLSPGEQDRWRQGNIGFVFQDFYLIPHLTPLENVLLPVYFHSVKATRQIKAHAEKLLERVGLGKCNINVEKLSRGEKQRVAIARALIMTPPIILADEPTGSLDRSTADEVVEVLLDIHRENGTVLIVASHDPVVANSLSEVYTLSRGSLIRKGAGNV